MLGKRTWRPRSESVSITLPELATAAENDDKNATSTPAVDSSSPYARAPAHNPTPTEPRSSTPTQPCPSNTKPDVDERDESSVFGQGHVRRLQRGQEERQGVHFVLEESQTQTGPHTRFRSSNLLTGGVFVGCRDKDRPSPNTARVTLPNTPFSLPRPHLEFVLHSVLRLDALRNVQASPLLQLFVSCPSPHRVPFRICV